MKRECEAWCVLDVAVNTKMHIMYNLISRTSNIPALEVAEITNFTVYVKEKGHNLYLVLKQFILITQFWVNCTKE